MSLTHRWKLGPNKYAALNLLIAKWLRHHAISDQQYCYVTLGGSELYDVANLNWIDNRLTQTILSYEQNPSVLPSAQITAGQFRRNGINVEIVPDDIFQYRRRSDLPHVFYIDLLGTLTPDPYRREFKIWFEDEVIQPRDLLVVTSYLGRNPGWNRVLQPFDSEFRILKISSPEEKKKVYRATHPLFVLNRALMDAGLNKELRLRGFGFIKYRDKSVMGLYGITCEEGATNLGSLVSEVSAFDAIKRDWLLT
jgi:hypothetical protein